MRLWASSDSLTFDEYAPHLGSPITARFAVSYLYINTPDKQRGSGVHMDCERPQMVQVAELGRSVHLMNGQLSRQDGQYLIKSELDFLLCPSRSDHWLDELLDTFPNDLFAFLGSVSIYGSEFRPKSPAYEVIVHSFESFDLVYGSPTFGRWQTVSKYRDIASDPDVVGGNVLLADVEVLRRIAELD